MRKEGTGFIKSSHFAAFCFHFIKENTSRVVHSLGSPQCSFPLFLFLQIHLGGPHFRTRKRDLTNKSCRFPPQILSGRATQKKSPRLFRNRKSRPDNLDSFSAISAPSPLTAAAAPTTPPVTAVAAALTAAARRGTKPKRQAGPGWQTFGPSKKAREPSTPEASNGCSFRGDEDLSLINIEFGVKIATSDEVFKSPPHLGLKYVLH